MGNQVTLKDVKVGETYWVALKLSETASKLDDMVHSITITKFEVGNRFVGTLPHNISGMEFDEESLLDIGVIENDYNQHRTFFSKEDAEAYLQLS